MRNTLTEILIYGTYVCLKMVKNFNLIEKFNTDGFVDIFKGNKRENIQNFIGILAIQGANDMIEIAKVTMTYGKPKSYYYELKFKNYSRVLSYYNRLFSGRLQYTHGGKKINDEEGNPKRYDSPIKLGYVFEIESTEKKQKRVIKKYSLTLKGIFLTLGYNLELDELEKVINNASKVSLFFCFIKTVMNTTSVSFVKDLFIVPMIKVLLKSDMFQKGEIDFYFINFADAISNSLQHMMKRIDEERTNKILDQGVTISKKKRDELKKEFPNASYETLLQLELEETLTDKEDELVLKYKEKGIEALMDNTYFSIEMKEDWYESLLEYFYTKNELESPLRDFENIHEKDLVHKVMSMIHFTYYSKATNSFQNISKLKPKRSKQWIKQRKNSRIKLSRSTRWKEHQKYKKSDGRFVKKPKSSDNS